MARPPQHPIRLYVTNEAFAGLITQAKQADYVAAAAKSPRGLSEYIRAACAMNPAIILPHGTSIADAVAQGGGWIDQRPDYLRDLDMHPIRTDQALPMWVDHETMTSYRSERLFLEHLIPLDYLYRLALSGGITASGHPYHERRRAFPFGQPKRAASALLEVWGRRHLAPYNVPHSPRPRAARPLHQRNEQLKQLEIAW